MSKETSKGRKKAKSSSSKNGGETEGEGILKCICKKKSEKGTMIQCEACTVWQHTQCLGMNDSELPSHYICNSCLALREDLPSDFAFISNKALKKEFEDDFALENTDDRTTSSPPKEKPKYRKFSVLEKQLLDKYFGRYATTNDLKEKDNILLGLAVLLHCAPFGIGCLFKFIAEEATNFNKDDDASDDDDHDDPYKDWNLIKKNIYSSGISQVSSSPAFDTDMQEPVQLQVRKYGNDWGVMIQQSVDQKQFIAEYFGVWLSSNTACYEDTSPATRFMLAHPNSNICVDARRSGSIVRFLRRSCTPNVEVREVIGNDNTRRLGVFALEHLPPNVELTIAFDRPWKNYTCALKCACGSSLCPVMQWYDERSVAATKTLDIFRKKGTLQKLKSSVGRKQTTQEDSDVDDFEEEEPEKEEEGESDESEDTDEKEEKTPRGKKMNAKKGKQTASATSAASSTTNNGTGSRRNSTLEPPQPRNAAFTSAGLSREERKLQQIMRSFEKMENRERLATTADKKKKVGKTEKEKEKEPEKEKEKSKAGNAKRKTAETATSSASSTPTNANRKRTRVDSESEEEDTTKARRVSRKDNKNASPARDQVKSPATSTTPRNDLKRRLSTSEDSLKSPRAASPQPIASVSSPPLSSSGQAIPTKKAWLQDFEEKKSEACFPLKKKMLSNFYASAASSTESTSSTSSSPTVSSPKAQPPNSPQLIKAEKSASPVTPRSPQVPSAGDVKAKSSPSPQRRHSGLESIKREDAPSFRRSADSIRSEAPSGGAGRPDRRPLETVALPTFRREPSLDANRNDSSVSTPSSSTTPASTSTPIITPTPTTLTPTLPTPPPVSTMSSTNIPPVSNSAYYPHPPTSAPPAPSNSAFPNSSYGPAGPGSNSSFENHSSSSSFPSYSSRSSFAPRSPPVSAAPRGSSGPSSSYGSPTKQQQNGGAYHHHHRGSSGLLQTPPYPSSSGSSSSSRSFSMPHHSALPPPPPPSDYRFRPVGSSGGGGGSGSSGGNGGGGGSRYGGSAPPPPPPPYGGGGSHWSNSRTSGGSGGNPVRTQIDRYAPRRDYHFA